ncbi:Icc-related predicted phosphoesterase [Saccharopolyspora lacisalsi]|uniref:Icc-related predicted phosphoesterase n=1 Tax=Halosaccharopolyspora lacisalsi TaxID=1000566 RepID=A0A839DV69_9PSEU|nr:metallophosphoesterase [Halosaccharopolyspora lacisalsi]MBA8824810.1 Icc-related predicted phosphoesterase [Halosaccharopolyspora lacisalsi]
MIRIAAVGDVHLADHSRSSLRPRLEGVDEHADVLLLAGDLTDHGSREEARIVVEEIGDLPVPVIGVLGNHDHHESCPEEVAAILLDGGSESWRVRPPSSTSPGGEVDDAGTKGFGGGFFGTCGSSFGEREMKAFIDHSERATGALRECLNGLDAEYRLSLTHYAPVTATLGEEPRELCPFLGSSLLAEAIDSADSSLALHGHAHFGSEHGVPPEGVAVRDVAQPVLGEAFRVYHLDTAGPV